MPRRRPRRKSRSRSPHPLILILLCALCAYLTWQFLQDLPTPDILPRVLFSETANCSHAERLLVAGVMQNRIAHPAFGNLPTLAAVAQQPGAFSAVNDPANAQWQKSRHPHRLSAAERAIWNDCLATFAAPIPPARGPSGRPLVYYHDKSITKPASWNNSKWQATLELTTTHFLFYSIVPTNPAPR